MNITQRIVLDNLDSIMTVLSDKSKMNKTICLRLDDLLDKLGNPVIRVYFNSNDLDFLVFRLNENQRYITSLKHLQRIYKLRKVIR